MTSHNHKPPFADPIKFMYVALGIVVIFGSWQIITVIEQSTFRDNVLVNTLPITFLICAIFFTIYNFITSNNLVYGLFKALLNVFLFFNIFFHTQPSGRIRFVTGNRKDIEIKATPASRPALRLTVITLSVLLLEIAFIMGCSIVIGTNFIVQNSKWFGGSVLLILAVYSILSSRIKPTR
jgi:hypothetical protein